MDKTHSLPLNNTVTFEILKQLEHELDDHQTIRRATAATLTLSLPDTIAKLTQSDAQTIEAFLALAEDSFVMLAHFKTYLGYLEAGQTRLLLALTQSDLIKPLP